MSESEVDDFFHQNQPHYAHVGPMYCIPTKGRARRRRRYIPATNLPIGLRNSIFNEHNRSRVSPARREFNLLKPTGVVSQHSDQHIQNTGGTRTRLLLPNKRGDEVWARSPQEVIGNGVCRRNVGGRLLAVAPKATSSRSVFNDALTNSLLERSVGLNDKPADVVFRCRLGDLKKVTEK